MGTEVLLVAQHSPTLNMVHPLLIAFSYCSYSTELIFHFLTMLVVLETIK